LPRVIDLNADLAEGFPNDEALLDLVTSASICCGAHAGGPDVIRGTLRAALARGVITGAHPGYADRAGFGRIEQQITQALLRDLLIGQITSLSRIALELSVPIRFLKPHGALYNQAQRQEQIARAVLGVARELGLPVVGQPATLLEGLARAQGVPYVSEGFPERGYRADGSLIPRSEPGAIFQDQREIQDQALRLVTGGGVATLCIHGDDPHAVAKASAVRSALELNGIKIRSFLDRF
jgi:UPF0271 protein